MMKIITEVAKTAKIDEKYVDMYGKYKAKIDLSIMDELKNKKDGKLVLVTAITPTKNRIMYPKNDIVVKSTTFSPNSKLDIDINITNKNVNEKIIYELICFVSFVLTTFFISIGIPPNTKPTKNIIVGTGKLSYE